MAAVCSRRVDQAFYGRFAALRPAQAGAIAPILAGQDTLVLAGTGSGKTEAMIAPLVSAHEHDLAHTRIPLILYIAPTRALVNDVSRRLELPLRTLGIKSGVRHGERNTMAHQAKPAVLVTTPESLEVMLTRIPSDLTGIRSVVIDEVHDLYNTQRGMQLAILLHRLEVHLDRRVQVVGASATVADGGDLWAFMRPGVTPSIVADPAARAIRAVIRVGITRAEVAAHLAQVMAARPTKILVFAGSRHECDLLAIALARLPGIGARAHAHHSSLTRDEREAVERTFLTSPSAVCVATSTLELGIDIGDIDLVVLWGVPTGWQPFLQRIGRANRRHDYVNVYCAVPPDQAQTLTGQLGFQALLHQVRTGGTQAARPLAIYGAAAQQILSITTARAGAYVPESELHRLFAGWPHLDPPQVRAMIDHLVAGGYLRRHPVRAAVGADQPAHDLVDTHHIWGNFPLSATEVTVRLGQHALGRVPADVATTLRSGQVIAFAGRTLQITGSDSRTIHVTATGLPPTATITFDGAAPKVDITLPKAIWDLLRTGDPRADVSGELQCPELDRLQLAARHGRLPTDPTGQRQVTCAGLDLNRLICAWAGIPPSFATEDAVPAGIDLTRLPSYSADFADHADAITPAIRVQTRYQRLLPPHQIAAETVCHLSAHPAWDQQLQRLRTRP